MIDLYPWFALASSVGITALFGMHAWRMARARRDYHDDRSAVDLLVALCLLVASFGLALSALAAFLAPLGADVAMRSELRNAGLGLVRGVLFVTALVMVISDQHARRAV